MGRVKDAFFTDQPREVLADMEPDADYENDPAYIEWSNSVSSFTSWAKDINDNFNKEFGENDGQKDAGETERTIPF